MEDQNQESLGEAQTELPEYKSHKIVRAAKVVEVRDNSGENCEAAMANDTFIVWRLDNGGYVHVSKDLKMRGGDDPVGGYYMLYKDGFESWSPSRAFIEGYDRVRLVDRSPFAWMESWLEAYFKSNADAVHASDIMEWIKQQPMSSG